MIYAFIRSFIGGFGRALMDFYIQNSLWINTLILGYALLVVISHRNYFVMLEKIFTQIRSSSDKFSKEGIIRLTDGDYKKLDWEIVRNQIRFPLVSEPGSWGVKLVNQSFLKKEFTIEKLNGLLKTIQMKKG